MVTPKSDDLDAIVNGPGRDPLPRIITGVIAWLVCIVAPFIMAGWFGVAVSLFGLITLMFTGLAFGFFMYVFITTVPKQ